jgi:hypothetical protein
MLYEFRTYTCMPGVGEDNNQVRYILEWESHEQREAAWVAFRADPEWTQALAVSEKDGPTVARISNELLVAVPFSLEK